MDKKINLNLNLSTLIIAGGIILMLLFGMWKYNSYKENKLNDKLTTEINLKNALLDTITNYKNKSNEWVAEKLTIQETVKNLEKSNSQLTQSQKELVTRVKEVEKKNSIITAALISSQLKIDSLLLAGKTVIDTTNKTITFSDKYKNGSKEMNYSFTVRNVVPAVNTIKPSFIIDSLIFPNKMFVEFHWKDDSKNGYPITFSVSNSNDFFKTVNIDSYAIPEINKNAIKPNFWRKVGNFFTGSGNTLICLGIGGAIGGTAVLLLVK